jgi:CRISPR/Cas system-associated exonuclease Cas4 (RecB family)
MSIQEFSRNPIRTGILRSSVGYLYGTCARRLFYACRDNKIDVPPQQVFTDGINKHREIQSTKYPDMKHEYYIQRSIPTINGVDRVGVTYDNIDSQRIVEIKPRYSYKHNSMPAYVQTLIEKFVMPELPIFVYAYLDDQEFQIKADYEKSKVYIARILTAIKDIPPKIPNADKILRPCSECAFKEECWNGDSKGTKAEWEHWTEKYATQNYEQLKSY